MSLKFYLDTHISKQVALQLRQRGVDVLRCEEVGMAEATDEDHLARATQEGRVMVSMDSDFPRLHQAYLTLGKEHGGIVFVSKYLQGTNAIGQIIRQLLEYDELVSSGAGTYEADFYNLIYFIS